MSSSQVGLVSDRQKFSSVRWLNSEELSIFIEHFKIEDYGIQDVMCLYIKISMLESVDLSSIAVLHDSKKTIEAFRCKK